MATAAATGEEAAFEELYRRNVPVAWRVAHAVARNPDDASDAVADAFERVFRAVTTGRLSEPSSFRPYLLTATRRAAIDISRRAGRTAPTGEVELLERESASPGPPERAVASLEARLLVRAFRELPQRWRSVLWLVEVEDLSCQEAAEVLGETPNNVAQLAVRARVGLRKRYLEAVVRDHARPECQPVLEGFSTYAEGGLRGKQAARVDEHLRGCDACRRRLEELREVGTTLRRSAPPVPALLGYLVAGGWAQLMGRSEEGAAVAASLPVQVPNLASVSGWLSGVLPQAAVGTPVVERVTAWAAAGLLVLGISAGAVQPGTGGPTGPGGGPAVESAGAPLTGPSARGGAALEPTSIDLPPTGAPVPAQTAGAAGSGASSNAAERAALYGVPGAPAADGATSPDLGASPPPVEGRGPGLPGTPVRSLLSVPVALPSPGGGGPEAAPGLRSVLSELAEVGTALRPGGAGQEPAGPEPGGAAPASPAVDATGPEATDPEATDPQPGGP